jgi:hypothetical protein
MRPPASHGRNLFRGEAGHNPNPPAHQLAAGLDTLGLQDSRLETLLARTVAVPAARVLRMRRSISVLVAEREDGSPGPVEGLHQSPILIQWHHADGAVRVLDVTLTRRRRAVGRRAPQALAGGARTVGAQNEASRTTSPITPTWYADTRRSKKLVTSWTS